MLTARGPWIIEGRWVLFFFFYSATTCIKTLNWNQCLHRRDRERVRLTEHDETRMANWFNLFPKRFQIHLSGQHGHPDALGIFNRRWKQISIMFDFRKDVMVNAVINLFFGVSWLSFSLGSLSHPIGSLRLTVILPTLPFKTTSPKQWLVSCERVSPASVTISGYSNHKLNLTYWNIWVSGNSRGDLQGHDWGLRGG